MAKEDTGNENEVLNDADSEATANETDDLDGQGDGTGDGDQDQNAKLNAAITMANAEKDKRQAAETEAQTAKDQLALMATHSPQQPTVEQKTLYRNVAERLGIDPELADPEEQGRIFETMLNVSMVQQQQGSFINSHTDYADVVGVTLSNGQFQAAPPLMRVMKENPALARSLMQNPNAEIAYALASKDPQYLKEKADKGKPADVKAAEKAEEAIKAAAKKVSISAAGSAGSVDKTAEIAGKSDEELDEYIEKIKSEA